MPNPRVVDGGHLRVAATDDGKPYCCICEQVLKPADMYLLVRSRDPLIYNAWCVDCSTLLVLDSLNTITSRAGHWV
jgi:hypothetical protein